MTNCVMDQMLYMQLVTASGRIAVPTHLMYRADDPFAVHIVFPIDTDPEVPWLISRDLLSQGFTQQSGEGDVRIWPTGSGPDAELNFVLSPPLGAAVLTASLPAVQQWLEGTYALVPSGHEADCFDVDVELSRLLH